VPRRYSLSVEPVDARQGWTLGRNRVLPRSFTVRVHRYFRFSDDRRRRDDLSDADVAALFDPASATRDDWQRIGVRNWLELEVVSSPTEPPRCVSLRAPDGISTHEQRVPLAGILAEAASAIASEDGSFVDYPRDTEYQDMVAEIGISRGRRRKRRSVTPERLAEVREVALANPRTPTAAVRRHFEISRVYARKLIKLSEALDN
jgi:hypothetical protein